MGLIAKLSLSLSGCAILFLKTMENLDLWVIVSDAVCVCMCVCVCVCAYVCRVVKLWGCGWREKFPESEAFELFFFYSFDVAVIITLHVLPRSEG